jgi:HK97 gp10 family phage protein
MIGTRAQFHEGDTLANLDKLEREARTRLLFSGASAMSRVFYEEARLNAARNRKTGTLYEAIYRVHSKDRSTEDRVTYQVSWNHRLAPHGHLIEFGTSRAPAYPFIRPAFARAADAVQAGLARMTERMDEITKGLT